MMISGGPEGRLPAGRLSEDRLSMLDKAIVVLDTLAADHRPLGVSELARRTKLPKATTHRVLHQLSAHCLVENLDKGYVLGKHVVELTRAFHYPPHALRRACVPHMLDLYVLDTRNVVYLGVRENRTVRYLAVVHGHSAVRPPARGADNAPLHCTAIGRALLAYEHPERIDQLIGTDPLVAYTPHTVRSPARLSAELQSVRRDGVAHCDREYRSDIACVAVPVLDTTGHAIGALAVGGPQLDREAVSHRLRRIAYAVARSINAGP
ncbi:IclR family transcriptional regulator [Nocardia colli]|uniref:IclR family transcriptional regulator n=1 Tax=Nocardia colli TaxID=2545717 RepID=A0A5N0EL23_9NOCA|nr:IclR family transcriptional regulator [Nocardia colli]KAA8889449.1 IclR family transcriptional regulator [Nocardia colli]